MEQQNTHPVLPNFDEETKGFSPEEAQVESAKCLNCKNPLCKTGCPVSNDIPGFIQEIKKGHYAAAYDILFETTNLPAICSRVCPHEKQCQGACILGKKGTSISIGKLERFVADHVADHGLAGTCAFSHTRQKVAIIGSGPAGLAAAYDLAHLGYEVTIFEAESTPGGVLTFGIPEYRLPKKIVQREIHKLEVLGIKIMTDTVIGEDLSLDGLFEQGFEAIFIASGAGSPRKLDIRGVYLPGVFYANYFLATVNLVNLGKLRKEEIPIFPGDEVVVLGAGNVAMDAARTCKRLGASKVTILYRGDYTAIPALGAELTAAQEEGVEIMCNIQPVRILGTTRVTGIRCQKTEVSPEFAGHIKILDEFNLNANKIILAIGQRPRSRIVSSTDQGVVRNEQGYLITSRDNFGHTSREGVFAGGDVVTAPATVVSAMKQGKAIAREIHSYLESKSQA